MNSEPESAFPSYQVGTFALVRHQDDVLLVRPYQLLLPGGPQSLPGALVDIQHSGLGVVETALRRLLLSQLSISVSEFWLVGSHTLRTPGPDGQAIPRLNLIFGTDYCSGILNPQPLGFKSAIWVPRSQLMERVPEWLSAALFELEKVVPPPGPRGGSVPARRHRAFSLAPLRER
ncbi:hypothetical protein [Deinococcus radiodurans]|uniref:hypothetical protein n=1 Tax=Deinococcus radiodurans TaxID=1299 RepID=UPI002016F850|nr:hypothetical protein [Deinococcus radiodurans]